LRERSRGTHCLPQPYILQLLRQYCPAPHFVHTGNFNPERLQAPEHRYAGCGHPGVVWPHGVVVSPLGLDDPADLGWTLEPVLVEPFIPELPIEALHEGVVHGFARGHMPDTMTTMDPDRVQSCSNNAGWEPTRQCA
jgi:hypothetical protein